MPRIHRLQHFQRLAAPDLPNDDAVRTHSETRPDQIAHGNLLRTIPVLYPCFQADKIRYMADLKLCRILDRNDAFLLGNIAGHGV